MTCIERAREYILLALLVAMAVTVAFVADEGTDVRTRWWSVRSRWIWAARDASTTATVSGATVTMTSTRQVAMRLLLETIGDLS